MMKFAGSRSVHFEQDEIGRNNQDNVIAIEEDASGKSKLNPEYDYTCIKSISGSFHQIPNDFSYQDASANANSFTFSNEPEWTNEHVDKVKRFRFVIAILALSAVSLSLSSRMILNLAIVEMVKSDPVVTIVVDETTEISTFDDNVTTIQPELFTTLAPELELALVPNSSESELILSDVTVAQEDSPDGMKFAWTKAQVNALIGSFYIGYAPSILFSGGLADNYGSKYPLLAAILGGSIINLLTPTIARFSFEALVTSRIILGIIQGGVMPCQYDVFNKWLTPTEASILVPIIKVSMPLGSLIGTSLPGLMSILGFEWPFLFYAGSLLGFVWTFLWCPLFSSKPHTSRFVEPNELKRITRKRENNLEMTKTIANNKNLETGQEKRNANKLPTDKRIIETKRIDEPKTSSTPWRRIATNPSVLALTLVKYTYNIGMDFFYLELAVYLRDMHDADIETISKIASSGYFMQMILITFIGLAAKNLVNRRAFGLSVTNWRKIFQGTSNLGMAAIYFAFPLLASDLTSVTLLIIAIWFFWMLGAGGESLVPYDLSSKYPAAIVGIAHSISIFSGLSVPALCSYMLQEDSKDPNNWNTIFRIVGYLLAIGGIVFVLVLKAKPFLPEEKQNRTEKKASHHSMEGIE